MIVEVSRENYDSCISNNDIVIVYFYKDVCAPCKLMGEILNKLDNDYSNNITIAKFKCEDPNNIQFALSQAVRNVPDIRIFHNGLHIKSYQRRPPNQNDLVNDIENITKGISFYFV